MTFSDWIALSGLLAAVAGIAFGLVADWVRRAITDAKKGRPTLIKFLEEGPWHDRYRGWLFAALGWLDRRLGTVWSIRSFFVCASLSLIYSLAGAMYGWAAGAPSTMGQVELLPHIVWLQDWLPDPLTRLVTASGCSAIGLIFLMAARRFAPAQESFSKLVNFHRAEGEFGRLIGILIEYVAFFLLGSLFGIIGGALGAAIVVTVLAALNVMRMIAAAYRVAYALPGVLAFSGTFTDTTSVIIASILSAFASLAFVKASDSETKLHVVTILGAISFSIAAWLFLIWFGSYIGDDRNSLQLLLFLIVLPYANGLLDWISRSVSRLFGKAIIDTKSGRIALFRTLTLAVADLICAVILLFITAWILAFSIEASAVLVGQSIELEHYIDIAVFEPWTGGLWATIMVLSTLLPTATHFILACAALLFSWSGNSMGKKMANNLRENNPALDLGPTLYIAFGWVIPIVVVPITMGVVLVQIFELIEPLSEFLREVALHAIQAARSL